MSEILHNQEVNVSSWKKIYPIIGEGREASFVIDMCDERKKALLESKAPEHTKQFNDECE